MDVLWVYGRDRRIYDWIFFIQSVQGSHLSSSNYLKCLPPRGSVFIGFNRAFSSFKHIPISHQSHTSHYDYLRWSVFERLDLCINEGHTHKTHNASTNLWCYQHQTKTLLVSATSLLNSISRTWAGKYRLFCPLIALTSTSNYFQLDREKGILPTR